MSIYTERSIRSMLLIPSRRSGFTLIEVIVAFTIGMMVLLGARYVLNNISYSVSRIMHASEETDRIANSERTMRSLIGNIVASDSLNPFTGNNREVRFTSWCDVPDGWKERCIVGLTLDNGESIVLHTPHYTSKIEISKPDNPKLQSKSHSRFLYLEDPAQGGIWRAGWSRGMTTPLAIGIESETDTTIYIIGERR